MIVEARKITVEVNTKDPRKFEAAKERKARESFEKENITDGYNKTCVKAYNDREENYPQQYQPCCRRCNSRACRKEVGVSLGTPSTLESGAKLSLGIVPATVGEFVEKIRGSITTSEERDVKITKNRLYDTVLLPQYA